MIALLLLPNNALAFAGFSLDFRNGAIVTSSETSPVTFGVTSAGVRVEASDPSSVATITGKYHSNEHGIQNFTAVVAVDGAVKMTFGSCAWGGDVTVKNSSNETVATISTNTGSCYHQNTTNNVVTCYYSGDPTTLTISGGNYMPYFAVEATSYVPDNKTVTFSLGGETAEGTLPESVTQDIKENNKYTLLPNRTLFKDGYTLTGWTDGVTTYGSGDILTITDDVTLNAVFTANTVSLDDRTAETTVVWDFQRKNSAPLLNIGGSKTGVYVTQVTVSGETIDIKMDYNTNSGKIANGSWTDWCQLNGTTTFTIPVCKSSVITIASYNQITTGTINGDNNTSYSSTGSVGNYTTTYNYTSDNVNTDIVIGDGSYFRTFTVTYPVIDITPAKEMVTYSNADYALDFTGVAGLTAYQVTSTSATSATIEEVTTAVPANTGLLLMGTASTTYSVPVATVATTALSENKLVAGSAVLTGDGTEYVLSNGKFVKATAGSLPAGKAYLKLDASLSRELTIDFGETTGINVIETEANTADGIYTLSGQKVNKFTKGLYIVNGKKVLAK